MQLIHSIMTPSSEPRRNTWAADSCCKAVLNRYTVCQSIWLSVMVDGWHTPVHPREPGTKASTLYATIKREDVDMNLHRVG